MEVVTLENSDVRLTVHEAGRCAGEFCTIHNRSSHEMRSWTQHWRSDRKIMERICPTHGTGIPDPDSPWDKDSYEWIHGSCGCPGMKFNGELVAFFKRGIGVTKTGAVISYIHNLGVRSGNKTEVRTLEPPRILKPTVRDKGYRVFTNHGYLHRLVWWAWNGEIRPGLQVRHLDDNPSNNCLSNLALGTQKDNEADKDRNGNVPRLEAHVNSKLTVEKVIKARRMWKTGVQLPEILREVCPNVKKATLHDAIIGRTWKTITDESPSSVGRKNNLL